MDYSNYDKSSHVAHRSVTHIDYSDVVYRHTEDGRKHLSAIELLNLTPKIMNYFPRLIMPSIYLMSVNF